MTQRPLDFDSTPPESEQLAQRGIARASNRKADLLDLARKIAVRIALGRPDRTCTADDVVAELVRRGYSPHALGRAAGGIFRGSNWEFTGHRVRSERACGHGNELKLWRYAGPISQVPTAKDLTTPEAGQKDATPCPRCRRLTASVLVPIHGGRSTRADCAMCNAVKGFPNWNPPPILGQLAKEKR